MKKLGIAALAGAVLASGIVLGLMGPAASQANGKRETITVWESPPAPQQNVNANSKSHVGDYQVGHGGLFSDSARKHRVGSEAHVCLNVSQQGRTRFESLCHGDFLIAGRGKIVLYGRLVFKRGKKGARLSITGGTGDFSDARGSAFVTFANASKFTFDIQH